MKKSHLKLIKLVEPRKYKSGKQTWYGLYQCSCGKQKVINVYSVKYGRTISCGHVGKKKALQNLTPGDPVKYGIEFKPGNEMWKKRKQNKGRDKGKFRLYEKPNDYSKYIYVNDEELGEISVGIVPSTLRSKLSICERTGSITLH